MLSKPAAVQDGPLIPNSVVMKSVTEGFEELRKDKYNWWSYFGIKQFNKHAGIECKKIRQLVCMYVRGVKTVIYNWTNYIL